MAAKSKQPNLNCKSQPVIETTTLDLENFLRELTGHPINIFCFYDQDDAIMLDSTIGSKQKFVIDSSEILVAATSLELQKMWSSVKESGEIPEYFTLQNLLAILARHDYISPGTYIIEVVAHRQKSILSEEITDILHDAVMKVCNGVIKSKDSDLHVNMLNEVWAAADRVLRAHNNIS
jgi:hypothetical protein